MYSSLTNVYIPSPHHRGVRLSGIDRITIHCVVGQCTAEALGYWFQLPEVHSCNYGIARDGRVLCCVDEEKISICSSSYANDSRAVTIETASDTCSPYTVKPEALQSLIALCVDICRRNGKTRLLWLGDKWKTLQYEPKPTEMVLTVHRWFSSTICPGEFLFSRMGQIAEQVTDILNREDETMRYDTITDCPEWAQPTVRKLVETGILEGTTKGLDLSLDMCRMLVILDRSGAFDGRAANE